MEAKERHRRAEAPVRPLLMVDVDGVISLFGGWQRAGLGGPPEPRGRQRDRPGGAEDPVAGSLHSIDGMPHFLSSTAAAHLLALSGLFELVWASGWEERANEHLPHLLGLPPALPFLRFERASGPSRAGGNAHWKLDAIDAYAGARALAWVDDALNDACHEWARGRGAPTLLVQTEPARGLTAPEALRLERWARELARA